MTLIPEEINYKEAYEKELENLKLERELDELAAELEDVA